MVVNLTNIVQVGMEWNEVNVNKTVVCDRKRFIDTQTHAR